MCKAAKCENRTRSDHPAHYCCMCKSTNADHLARDCQDLRLQVWFCITTPKMLSDFKTKHLLRKYKKYGQSILFVDKYQNAVQIGKALQKKNLMSGLVILKCRVGFDKVQQVPMYNKQIFFRKFSAQYKISNKYDAVRAKQNQFGINEYEQLCLYTAQRVRAFQAYLIDAQTDKASKLNGGWLLEKKSCQLIFSHQMQQKMMNKGQTIKLKKQYQQDIPTNYGYESAHYENPKVEKPQQKPSPGSIRITQILCCGVKSKIKA